MKQIFTLMLALGLLTMTTNAQGFEEGKPVADFEINYQETFATWDSTKFFDQWETVDPSSFTGVDDGYLQFTWAPKRIIVSKDVYAGPYIFEVDLDYTNHNNSQGGVVIRINPGLDKLDKLQEPHANGNASNHGNFNNTGIAFYPSKAGDGWNSMVVQFSGADETEFAQIAVPKPDGVETLKIRANLKIEDYGSTIYVYYNDNAYIRIDFGEITNGKYTSGTVYNSAMEEVGNFSNIQVDASGKVSVAQRATNFRLHEVVISKGELSEEEDPIDISWYDAEQTEFNISTAKQLLGLAELVNTGVSSFEGKTVNLIANITLNNTSNWSEWNKETADLNVWPIIGLGASQFNGTLDGQGHVIKGIFIPGNAAQQGLFKQTLADAIIRNLGIEESFIYGTNAVGAFVGLHRGLIENCYSSATISGSAGGIGRGGIAGRTQEGTIKNCYNTGTINLGNRTGGIVGWNTGGEVLNCLNSGVVNFNPDQEDRTGSIVGLNAVEGENQPIVLNCWHLEQAEFPGIGSEGIVGEATAKTAAELTGGEVANLLQGDQEDLIWGHSKLNDGEFPLLAAFNDAVKEVFEVTFTVSDDTYHRQYALDGASVTFPTAPDADEGESFSGWKIAGTDDVFNEGDAVTSDLLLTAIFDDQTSIESIAAHAKLHAYPNPFTDQITLVNTHNIARIVILNATGMVVMDKSVNESLSHTINTQLPDGIYMLLLQSSNGREQSVIKMIK